MTLPIPASSSFIYAQSSTDTHPKRPNQPTSPRPKRRQLDRKNGKGLAKDTTRPVVTLISESYAQEDVALTGDTVRGKGTLIPANEVMAYTEFPNVVHEFATQLQFGTTFEVMESLPGQQIKLSQRMADEHAEM